MKAPRPEPTELSAASGLEPPFQTRRLPTSSHHLAYNFTYNGKCTSATPLFDGVEPTTWTDANGVTHAPLEAQRAATVALLNSVGLMADAKLSGTFSDLAVSVSLLAEYESDDALSQTYVGYSGSTDLTTQSPYVRIDGPRVWIELTVQGGIV